MPNHNLDPYVYGNQLPVYGPVVMETLHNEPNLQFRHVRFREND